ncbi:hypothetical protein PI124_g22553, partial [Phytophthora idaei]
MSGSWHSGGSAILLEASTIFRDTDTSMRSSCVSVSCLCIHKTVCEITQVSAHKNPMIVLTAVASRQLGANFVMERMSGA